MIEPNLIVRFWNAKNQYLTPTTYKPIGGFTDKCRNAGSIKNAFVAFLWNLGNARKYGSRASFRSIVASLI